MIGESVAERPNFILFVTDQHRADFLGCYGHPVLRTPTIDGLAQRGICFDRFYVASPVCMPNRASLMTGRMPSLHGVRLNGVPLSTRNVTFVELLREAGYRTLLVGKSHLQNFTGNPPHLVASVERPGFHRARAPLTEALRDDLHAPQYEQENAAHRYADPPPLRVPFYGFEQVDLVTGHGDRCGGDYARWLREREPHAERLMGAANQRPHDYICPQAVRTSLPEELYSTRYVAERAATRLGELEGRPFFMMVSFPDPHHPFNPPGRYWDMYSPQQMSEPEAFSRDDWRPPAHVQAALSERSSGRAALNGMRTIACSAREALEARALTCGMITMIDDGIGQVLEALERSGRAGETVVAFTTDHGDHLGDHKLLLKGAEQYADIIRAPFIWADPEGPHGDRRDDIGQTIDIAATVLERARIEPYRGMQGIDLLDGGGREAAFIQYDHQRPYDGLGGPPRVHTLVDKRWRISLFHGQSWGELYDLDSDPGEFENRWDDSAAAAEKARLLQALALAELDAVDRVPSPTAQA